MEVQFQFFLDSGLSVDDILPIACRFSRTDWCEMCLQKGACPNGIDWAARLSYWQIRYLPLCEAVVSKAYGCIRMLVKWGAHIDALHGLGKRSAMCEALERNDIKAIALLLELGADPHGWGSDEIWVRKAMRTSVEATELFLDYGAKLCNVDDDEILPGVKKLMRHRRVCKEVARTLYGILRKRYRVPAPGFADSGGYKLPKEIANQIARGVWVLGKSLDTND